MKRYPLQVLIQLRQHRAETARQTLLMRQGETQACRDACQRLEHEIEALHRERDAQRLRLLEPLPANAAPTALGQREAHITHLGELSSAALQRLHHARVALQQAEVAQDQARQAFFRAKARQEALEKRKTVWRHEQGRAQARREEVAVGDLILARHIATQSPP